MSKPLTVTAVAAVAAASALVLAPAVHAVDRPAAAVVAREDAGVISPARGVTATPGLDAGTVARYSQYVSLGTDGRFTIAVPGDVERGDPAGAAAARDAVERTNRLVAAQRAELARRGERATVTAGRSVQAQGAAATAVLPIGQHATFQADWWGMTFTLDATATRQLNDAIAATKDIKTLLDTLAGAGIAIAPEVAGIVEIVLSGLQLLTGSIAASSTPDGLVIKSLWALIPWVEKPTGPFRPVAPASTGLTGLTGRPGVTATRTASAVPSVLVG